MPHATPVRYLRVCGLAGGAHQRRPALAATVARAFGSAVSHG